MDPAQIAVPKGREAGPRRTHKARPADEPALEAELDRCVDHIRSLQANNTTIIQLTVLGLVGGIAAYHYLRLSFVLVPLIISMWVFYLLAVDRETRKEMHLRAWLEETLNDIEAKKLGDTVTAAPAAIGDTEKNDEKVGPYCWHSFVEEGASASVATPMLYAIYGLAIIVNFLVWIGAEHVLSGQIASSNSHGILRQHAAAFENLYITLGCLIFATFLISFYYNMIKLMKKLSEVLPIARAPRYGIFRLLDVLPKSIRKHTMLPSKQPHRLSAPLTPAEAEGAP
ncbi:MAG: hypothetical protein ACRDZR_00335 [Acidimicrobiales bacterium]